MRDLIVAVVFAVAAYIGFLLRRSACSFRPASSRASSDGCLRALLDGFETALTPVNLMWSLVGVTLGTLIGILPGIGPALTIALLLPITRKLDPTGAFIMFAGLYYGAMYGSSTTSILLNTPGEIGLDHDRRRRQCDGQKGRGAAALATAAIGSFVAGTLGTLAADLPGATLRQARVDVRPGRIFRADDAGLHHRLGAARLVDAQGRRQPDGRPGARPGRHRHADRPAALHVRHAEPVATASMWWLSRSGCSRWARRSTWPRARYSGASTILPIKGSLFMTREEWRRSWKPWLAGTALGFPFGALPAGGTEIPTFLSYFLEKKLAQAAGGIRQGRDRRRRGAGSRQQCRGGRRAGAAADARPADLGHGGDPACRLRAVRPAARPVAVLRFAARWSGA